MTGTSLKIGFARLSDCAPIAIAKEHGLFEANGLEVELVRFASWAAMRDALGTGMIDAAHMLSPIVVASAAGLGPFPGAFTTALTLNLNGNAITVSTALYREMVAASPESITRCPLTACALKSVIDRRVKEGASPLTLAHVYTHSMHAYELRYWLADSGIDPDNDVRLVVVPPSQMVSALDDGQIDGFCVGEPWNSAAVSAGIGRTLITSGEIWSNGPEKVLAVRHDWLGRNAQTHADMLHAVIEACVWLDQPTNRIAAARVISSPDYVDAPFADIIGSLSGIDHQTAGNLRVDMPDFNVFHRYAANFPWRSHAKWILSQMIRWGEAPAGLDYDAIAESAFQPEIYRRVAATMNIACPLQDTKPEGAHVHAWLLSQSTGPIAFGPDRFLDGRVFDPQDIDGYVAGFDIRHRGSRLGERDEAQALALSQAAR
ncbi:MAG: CmpA/NrtA family ABC transporter substrate-binding protein [Hyphomonas sp.]|uniref:CmpA/NrtA family ABC transporter substrate-binding protein n=1 Tax=Hyphomonas sp. TaxID=87 RepID=UPI00300253AC